MTNIYTPNFYDTIRPGVRSSAEAIVPVMADWYDNHDYTDNPDRDLSVVDVGCGEGWWALEWVKAGYASSATGIDGPWPGAGDALVHRDDTDFVPIDFGKLIVDPRDRPQVYDIAICLEVAEHLDNPDCLMEWLRKLAPVVFFSAATPGQPGANHLSCKWQHEWADYFRQAFWRTADPIRPAVWDDPRVEWWYAQNLFVAWDPTGPIDAHDEAIRSMIHYRHWEVR